MNDSVIKLKKDFQKKIPQLEKARVQLKKEYVGIDSAIDEIIENMRSWFTLAEIQPKPNIVNLWGLTGVGKTSLIQRLSELLSVDERTFRIDLGEKDGEYALKASIKEIAEVSEDEPMIIILDEFQHARTLKGGIIKEEIEKDENRIIWDLIDSGKITNNSWGFGKAALIRYMELLSVLMVNDVKIESGVVTQRVDLFAKEVTQNIGWTIETDMEKVDAVYAIPEGFYQVILSNMPKRYKIDLHEQLKEHLLKLDGDQTLSFVEEVLREIKKPEIHYFNKALIFVVGNIDEAYRFGANQSADISADEFYEQSKEISIPKIKAALRDRFRDEQIARLGNTHIIYPALNQQAYRELIIMTLKKYFDRLQKNYDIVWTFDQSLVDKIYAEGVYPTQGARPVFTTIDQLVKSKTAIIFQRLIEQSTNINKLELSVEKVKLVVDYFSNDKNSFQERFDLPSSLDALRQPKNDDNQAITAVHEAGHAVLMANLLERAPQLITAVTSDSTMEGFVFARPKYKYFPKIDLIRHAAMKLGGLMAEQLIFGKDHQTIGSLADLQSMYKLIDTAYKSGGMGKHMYYYANNSSEDDQSFHNVRSVEKEIVGLIDEAKELALQTLKSEKRMLLHLADRLQHVSKVEEKEFIELYQKFGARQVDFDADSDYYRKALKRSLSEVAPNEKIAKAKPIILSKDNYEITKGEIK